MPHNFDEIIERRTSNSIKWTQYPADVLPLWVADMDFRTPQPILDGSKHIPMASLSPEVADKTITLIAGSKTFNTAGLLCAFAIIPNADLREKFKVANEQITGHVSSLGLIGAEATFSGACDK